MSTAPAILERMDENERTELLEFCGILADPLTRRILAYLAATDDQIPANASHTKPTGGVVSENPTRLKD